jgi:hypothetical protein
MVRRRGNQESAVSGRGKAPSRHDSWAEQSSWAVVVEWVWQRAAVLVGWLVGCEVALALQAYQISDKLTLVTATIIYLGSTLNQRRIFLYYSN